MKSSGRYMPAMNKYLYTFFISAKQTWRNRTLLLGTLFFLMILLFIYNRLWQIIGIESSQSGLQSKYVWYLLLSEIIILSAPKNERLLQQDIKSGTFAYYINKPVSFLALRFAEYAGTMSVSFFFMLLLGGCATAIMTPQPPFLAKDIPAILLAAYISSLINIFMFTAIGFCALWMNDVRPLGMVIQRLAFVLGGAIFPLSIYPEWFVKIASFTPFYAFYYKSIRLVYDFSYAALAEALILDAFWLAVLGFFVSIAYKKALKRINVYGG